MKTAIIWLNLLFTNQTKWIVFKSIIFYLFNFFSFFFRSLFVIWRFFVKMVPVLLFYCQCHDFKVGQVSELTRWWMLACHKDNDDDEVEISIRSPISSNSRPKTFHLYTWTLGDKGIHVKIPFEGQCENHLILCLRFSGFLTKIPWN